MAKIIVEIQGGCVVSVRSDDPEISCDVLDYDNMNSEGCSDDEKQRYIDLIAEQTKLNIYIF